MKTLYASIIQWYKFFKIINAKYFIGMLKSEWASRKIRYFSSTIWEIYICEKISYVSLKKNTLIHN